MTVRAAWLLPNAQTREDTRLAPIGAMTPEGELTSRDGLIPGGNPLNATGAGPMRVQLGVGRAVVQGTLAQGAYPVAVTSPETLPVEDGNAQFDRIDSIVLRVYDGSYDTSADTRAAVEIIKGTPAATPAPPKLPPAALRLWDVTVPAGASAGVGGLDWTRALADRRRYTVAPGGIIPRGWGLTFDGAHDGQYRDNGTGLERWSTSASAWQALDPVIGWTTVNLASGYSHDGNAHGPVKYRRIVIAGVPHVQWRGGVGWSANNPPADGYPIAAALPANCRPARHVSLVAAAGGTSVNVDFQRTGQVRIIGASGVRWLSFMGLQYPLDS